MGGIIMSLIGRHLRHTEEARALDRETHLAPLFSYNKDPLNSPYTPEQVDAAISDGIKAGYLPKEHEQSIRAHAKQAGDARAAFQANQGVQVAQPQPMGVPSMTPGADAAKPAPAPPQLPAPPTQGMAPPPGGSAGVPLPVQLAMASLLQGQQPGQQQPAPSAPGGPPAAPIPPPLAAASASGGQGFSGPTPAPQPQATAPPAGPQFTPPGMPEPNIAAPAPPPAPAPLVNAHRFTVPAMTLAQVAARKGEAEAAEAAPGLRSQAQIQREEAQKTYEMIQQRYAGQPWFEALTPRQKAEIVTGRNIQPELRPQNIPGLIQGKSISAETDALGNPIDHEGFYKARALPDGQLEYIPQLGSTVGVVEPDKESPTGWSRVVRDKANKEIARSLAPPPAAYAPTQGTNTYTTMEWKQVGDHLEQVPVTHTGSTTSQKVVPGLTAPPAAGGPVFPKVTPKATAPAGATTQGAPAPARTSRTLESPQAWKMRMENQYTPEGAKLMSELEPRMKMVQRVKDALEPYKDSDVPGNKLLDSIKYKLGISGDNGGFLSQLNLGGIAQAASLVRGASRSKEVLGQAMIHTPDAWKDSGKLMYQKVSEILHNMQDMREAADKYERKYPGLTAPNAMTAPPPGAESEADVIKRLAAKHGGR